MIVVEMDQFTMPPPPAPPGQNPPGPPPPPPPPPIAAAPEPPAPPAQVSQREAAVDDGLVDNVQDLIMARLANQDARQQEKPKKASTRKKKETTDDSEDNEDNATPGGRTRQPRRSSRQVDEDRLYDGTQLHANHHGYFVHRDYAAHFFRWGFAARRVKPGMRVLDVGSGQDLALPRVLSAPNVYPNCKPAAVVCVDWNPITSKFNPAWLTVCEQFDFNKRWPEIVGSFLQDGTSYVDLPNEHFDLITCFEVIEHMDEQQGDELLVGIKGCLKPGGQAIISTPVFDGYAAANHIHEYGAQELWQKFQAHGFVVVERYGTFASLDVINKVLPPEEKALVVELSRFYGNDVISCFLAPKYPDYSRNNCWVIMRAEDIQGVPGAS